MISLLTEARIVVYHQDLGLYLAAGLFFTLTQGLAWSIARHTADLDFWRTGAFCLVVGLMTLMGWQFGGLVGVISGLALGMAAGWIILGFVFEFDPWQRWVMTGVGPILAMGSLALGYVLKGLILGT